MYAAGSIQRFAPIPLFYMVTLRGESHGWRQGSRIITLSCESAAERKGRYVCGEAQWVSTCSKVVLEKGTSIFTYTCDTTSTAGAVRVAATPTLFGFRRRGDVTRTATAGGVCELSVLRAVLFLQLVLARLDFGELLSVQRIARRRSYITGTTSTARDHVAGNRGSSDRLARDSIARAIARSRGRANDLYHRFKTNRRGRREGNILDFASITKS